MPLTLILLFTAGLAQASAQAPSSAVDFSNVHMITADTPVNVQIAIARSAGPPVSDKATIYVLAKTGYVRAVTGSNGFTCLVTRDRLDTIAPQCFDAAGTAATVPALLFVEEQRAHGVKEAAIEAAVEARYKSGAFTAPARAGIVYMLSPNNYLADPETKEIVHFPGHLMFYAPNLTAAEIGTGAGAPFMTHPGHPDNVMVVVPASSHPH